MRIGALDRIQPAKGRDQHEQGVARQVKIGHQDIDGAKTVAGRDEQCGLALEGGAQIVVAPVVRVAVVRAVIMVMMVVVIVIMVVMIVIMVVMLMIVIIIVIMMMIMAVPVMMVMIVAQQECAH